MKAIAIILLIAGLLAGAFIGQFIRTAPKKTTVTEPVETTIKARDVPAEVTTSPAGHEIATLDTTIVNKDKTAKAELRIEYDETDNLFDIDAEVTSQRITKTIIKPPPFVKLIAGMGIGTDIDKISEVTPTYADAEVGVRFVGKYDVKAFINTNKTIGLRIGVEF